MTEIVSTLTPTDGYLSHVLRAGEGNASPVVLLHGGGPGADSRANFAGTLSALGERFDVLAPDILGFGRTAHPANPELGPALWMRRRIAQLLALLDHFNIERATLVGNSLGGVITLQFVLDYPERVQAIVLMGSGGAPVPATDELKGMLAFYNEPTEDNLRNIFATFVYDASRFDGLADLINARFVAATRPEVVRSYAAMFTVPDGPPITAAPVDMFGPRLSEIRHPALIIHGRNDRIIPYEASIWYHDRLPQSDLTLLSACGHWAMLERADTFNALVAEFVSRVGAGSGR
jgi:2-hydroxymuconate-semialdehyde hydrolase